MTQKLTARTIARAPTSAQIGYFDEGLPGFALRVAPGGTKSWILFYRVHGRLRRLTLGRCPAVSLADARGLALRLSTRSRPAQAKQDDRTAETFADLAELYLERHAKKRKRSWKEDNRIIRQELLPHWRHVPVQQTRAGWCGAGWT